MFNQTETQSGIRHMMKTQIYRLVT